MLKKKLLLSENTFKITLDTIFKFEEERERKEYTWDRGKTNTGQVRRA